MRKLTFAVLFLLSSFTMMAQSTWNNDPMHSQLSFSTVHLGIADINGVFETFDVTIQSEKEDFSDAVFELSVDVSSINTLVKMRDDHLRSADFFHVEKFPKMTFKSKSIKKAGKNKYKLSGDLTLHGITKPVTMDLEYRGTTVNQQSNATTAGFQLTGTLKRSDFNIGNDFPEAMISDIVKIKADGEFIKK